MLAVDSVSVSFGGLKALAEVSLDVEAGAVTGLIGPNGAGKTTLFNAVCGLQLPDSGRIRLDERDITDLKPYQRARLGVGRTFQRLEVFGSLSVYDNILVAADLNRGHNGDAVDARSLAAEILQLVGLRDLARTRADQLPTGQARLLELGRALATGPRLLLLDEPSSGLDEGETDDLAVLLDTLASRGLAVLLVEHDVELVMRVCKRIHVLDFGNILAVGTPQEIRRNKAVQHAYLGGA
ncbi:MAG TPA: ABC transporter ATP-binding protein [Acidimicrobiales bacterium]|nr:ABC transporter ATP-binding protein [Acidimicrobiales bacterium]